MMKQEKNIFMVKNNISLILFLKQYGYSKNKIKLYVKLGYIKVNGKLIQKLPYRLEKNDKVILEIHKNMEKEWGLDIIYEDDNYCIVNKQAGLLTISTKKNEEATLYRFVRAYLNHKKEYAFIVNRIDKETSGLVVFVKNEKLKKKLQDHWNEIVKKRSYIAVVCGKITKSGRIDNYLYEDRLTFSHSTKIGGKRAITNYKPICKNSKYTMLDIWIETGRKNQIRVHMSEMNHPIVGDKKYHSKDNSMKRLLLHHYEISFLDPLSKQLLTFQSKIPKEFYDLFH